MCVCVWLVVEVVRGFPRKPDSTYSKAGFVWWHFGLSTRDANFKSEGGERQAGRTLSVSVFQYSAE